MASIPNNIVAKDSGGNIKKVDLDQLLAGYVQTSDIQQILQENWPDCLVSGEISFSNPSIQGQEVNTPLNVETVKLTTAMYGSSDVLYEASYNVDAPRIISRTTDAYRFTVSGTSAPFGVCSTKECFLVLSVDGLSSFAANITYDIEECQETKRHGGNPIVLDWKKVALTEGGTFAFSCYDGNSPFGIVGSLALGRRLEYTGNIHKFDFTLDFIVCGKDAWTLLYQAYRLKLRTQSNLGVTNESEVDLSPVVYPRVSSVGVSGQEAISLSNTALTKLTFKGEGGVVVSAATKDSSNVAYDEKEIAFDFDIDEIIGSGLANENGKIGVPVFTPATPTTNAKAGLVPGAQASDYDDILTVAGWKSFAEIGLNSILRPFVGATQYQDGDMGFVPTPYIANRGMYLKGDGTWSNAISTIDGELQCELSPVEKEVTFGINLCGSDGSWMMQAKQCILSLAPSETEDASFETDIPLADIHGVSVCNPWGTNVPMSVSNNDNGWVADKTFWSQSKTGTFSAIFNDGTSLDVWLTTRQDAENPDKLWTVVNYRGRGAKVSTARPFILSVDGAEQNASVVLSENESSDVSISGTEIKVWPTSTKTRILFEAMTGEGGEEATEEQSTPVEVPWGGYIWINQERTIMLQNGSLAYYGNSASTIALISYQEHPANEPILVYGLEPEAGFWDMVLQQAITYNDDEIPEGTVVGHVWEDNGAIKAASQLFANWSIQPTLQETNEEIPDPNAQATQEEEVIQTDDWIVINATPTYVSSLGLEFSRTADGIKVHAPAVNFDSWPKKADSVNFILDCGYTGDIVSMNCLRDWLNTRFSGLDKSISSIERVAEAANSVFAGSTAYSNGNPGLVPMATPADQNKTLMGNGTWSDQFTKVFTGADEEHVGKAGLVPEPAAEDFQKYLRGDGTWAVPTQSFLAVSSVSLLQNSETTQLTNYDFTSVLPQLNAYFAANLDADLYISLPSFAVGTSAPAGDGLHFQIIRDGDNVAVFIQELVNGVPGESTTQWLTDYIVVPEESDIDDGDGEPGQEEPSGEDSSVQVNFIGSKFELNAEATLDPETSAVHLESCSGWMVGQAPSISGIKVDYKNTTTGETATQDLDIRYKGATASANSVAGLVPFATSAQRDLFLRADGTWQVPAYDVSAYNGVSALEESGNVVGLQFTKQNVIAGTTSADEVDLSFVGASADDDGVSGLVPQPMAGDEGKILHGDGSWRNDFVITNTMPTDSDEGMIFFYVEE